jgi:predicted RNA-binding Zn-ribbon protein involved in translation (DUF1610 family)
MASPRRVAFTCPKCGGAATATLIDISTEESGHIRWMVNTFRCPEMCTLPDETIVTAAEVD